MKTSRYGSAFSDPGVGIPKDETSLETAVHQVILESDRRMPLVMMTRELAHRLGVTPGRIRRIIRKLIEKGRLAYFQELGSTWVGPAFYGVVQLTSYVQIKPPYVKAKPPGEGIQITLLPGAAFGDGRHPTTRIALRLLEKNIAVSRWENGYDAKLGGGLDIGTGSGILAIALARYVPVPILAVDLDPCARVEAGTNVRLNNMASQITVADTPVDKIKDRFSFILANLRYPTLKSMAVSIYDRSLPKGVMICSGLLADETTSLIDTYESTGFRVIDTISEGRWAGAAFRSMRG